MSFIKIGESIEFDPKTSILTPKEALSNDEIAKRFVKLAKKLKRIAPRANDFLYGHCIMMSAAERSLVDDNGEFLKNSKGEPVKGYFEDFVNKNGQESVRWISPDGIKPYKNANGDIFGENELIKAHKLWVGKPLCKDHKSDSVDGIRGIIIDTYYDPKHKHVHALFALDRKNYNDLARKVETGYSNSVSMGTAVSKSICFSCGNVALTEKDYCPCIKSRTHYGEINQGLNPIELSLVVSPADPQAKIRQIIASMNDYVEKKQSHIDELKSNKSVNNNEIQSLADSIKDIQIKLNSLVDLQKKEAGELGELAKALELQDKLKSEIKTEKDPERLKNLQTQLSLLESKLPKIEEEHPKAVQSTTGLGEGYAMQNNELEKIPAWSFEPNRRLANKGDEKWDTNEVRLLRSKLDNMIKSFSELKNIISNKEENGMNSARIKARAKARRAYWLGGGGVNDPTPGKTKYEVENYAITRDKEDKQMVGEPLETGSEGLFPGDKEVKEKLSRAELEQRKLQRRAYWLGGGGVNEPTPGKPKYEKEDSDSIRNKEDKQMVGEPLETGSDGLFPGDKEIKEKVLRAKLKAKFNKAASKEDSSWSFFADDQLILKATGKEIYDDELEDNWSYLSSPQYGKDVMSYIRSEGLDKVAYLLKGADDMYAATPEAPVAPVAPEATPAVPELPVAPEAPVAPAPNASEPAKEEPKDEMSEKVNSVLSAIEEKISEVRDLLSGEKSELAEIDVDKEAPMDKVLASVDSLLNDVADEMALISEAFENGNIKESVVKLANQALSDSQAIISEANIAIEAAKKKKDEKKMKKEDKKVKKDEKKMPFKKVKKEEEVEEDEEPKKGKKSKAEEILEQAIKVRAENRAFLLSKAMDYAKDTESKEEKLEEEIEELEEELDEKKEELEELEVEEHEELEKHEKEEEAKDSMCAHDAGETCDACMPAVDQSVNPTGQPQQPSVGQPQQPVVKPASIKAERDALIAKAEEILGKYQLTLDKAENTTEPTFFEAHPKGGTTTELTGTKTPEAKVETIEEVHKVMRDVAESGPRNVRDAAAKIQEKIVQGGLKAEDVEKLVSEGKADADAVAYWKKYFAQAPNSGSFGADLSKDFDSAKKKASDENYRVKVRRAYDIGLQAQDKGLINPTREALESYVNEIMKFDDAAFESTKKVVATYKSKKTNGVLPVNTTTAAQSDPMSSANDSVSLEDQLKNMW